MIRSLVPVFTIIIISLLQTCNVSAEQEGLGAIANNIYQPITMIIHLVKAVSLISGAGLILGGVLKFIDYRRNPVAVRLSAVFYMIFFGIALILVGFIPLKIQG